MLNTIAGAVVFLSRSPELQLLAKATLILFASLAIARLATRARASARHMIIAASFAALIALPILVASVPAIAIEMPAAPAVTPTPATAAPIAPAASAIQPDDAP